MILAFQEDKCIRGTSTILNESKKLTTVDKKKKKKKKK